MNQTERRTLGQYPTFTSKNPEPAFLVIKDTRFHNLTERMFGLFDNVKMVAIVRHPCGAIHSWLTAPGEFPRDADPLQEWRTGSCRKKGFGEFWGFDDWETVTRLHMKLEQRFPHRFIIQQYEHMVDDPMGETKKLFTFFGLDFTDQTASFVTMSQAVHNASEYSVFKFPSVKDRWQSELHLSIRKAIIEKITGTELERFLV